MTDRETHAADVAAAVVSEPVVEEALDAQAQEIEERGLVPVPAAAMARPEWTVDELVEQRSKISDAMERAMVKDQHYGRIPGVDKPSLLKPGAELLCSLFRLAPSYPPELRETTWHEDGHMTAELTCVLRHIPSGLVFADGVGLCSTLESKYAYRSGARVCPECGKAEVRKGKTKDKQRDQFYCWAKKGGCGATFEAGTDAFKALAEVDTGRTPNPDLADSYNTVLKMAAKRALVAAVLNATAASDVFTQDVEEAGDYSGGESREPVRQEQAGRGPTTPQSWQEIGDRFARVLGAEEDYAEWMREALEARWDKAFSELTAGEKQEAGQRASGALIDLEDEFAGAFPPPSRERVAAAFAKTWEGIALHGPPWRIGDGDPDGLPTHEQYVEAQAAERRSRPDESGKDDS